jgi:hypothetical protein
MQPQRPAVLTAFGLWEAVETALRFRRLQVTGLKPGVNETIKGTLADR